MDKVARIQFIDNEEGKRIFESAIEDFKQNFLSQPHRFAWRGINLTSYDLSMHHFILFTLLSEKSMANPKESDIYFIAFNESIEQFSMSTAGGNTIQYAGRATITSITASNGEKHLTIENIMNPPIADNTVLMVCREQ